MLTPDDKKFILMAIHDGMVELAGTTADLIEGVSEKINKVRDDLNEVKIDVSILKQQTIHTNKNLTLIRGDLSLVHRRVDFLEQARADRVNDTNVEADMSDT